MLTSKQRAFLRGKASLEDAILHIGKGEITPQIIKQMDDALAAREIVKGKVLQNSLYTPREAAETLAAECGAEVISVIGSTFSVYRASKKKLYTLP